MYFLYDQVLVIDCAEVMTMQVSSGDNEAIKNTLYSYLLRSQFDLKFLLAFLTNIQNCDNVKRVVKELNRIPSKQHGADIMRIRQWFVPFDLFHM